MLRPNRHVSRLLALIVVGLALCRLVSPAVIRPPRVRFGPIAANRQHGRPIAFVRGQALLKRHEPHLSLRFRSGGSEHLPHPVPKHEPQPQAQGQILYYQPPLPQPSLPLNPQTRDSSSNSSKNSSEEDAGAEVGDQEADEWADQTEQPQQEGEPAEASQVQQQAFGQGQLVAPDSRAFRQTPPSVDPLLEQRRGSGIPHVTAPYEADGGGCAPLTAYFKREDWYDWETRLPILAGKVLGMEWGTPEWGQRASILLNALGDKHMWVQILDGWVHPIGNNAFGPEYVADMKKGFQECSQLLKQGLSEETLTVDFYEKIHAIAYHSYAVLENRNNGFRDTGIVMGIPDKPLAVFHGIHNKGVKTYHPDMASVEPAGNTPSNQTYNQGYSLRWHYTSLGVEGVRAHTAELFKQFWSEMHAVSPDVAVSEKRTQRYQAVVKLYHSLENFHPFTDGNGRVNVLLLDTLLCFIGLHPVSFYNSFESAFATLEEMYEKVAEALFKWEEAYNNLLAGKANITVWTRDAIRRKNVECLVAVNAVLGKPLPEFIASRPFVPDTMSGCMCQDPKTCDTNPKRNGQQWCDADHNCTWQWDVCAPGRSSHHQHH